MSKNTRYSYKYAALRFIAFWPSIFDDETQAAQVRQVVTRSWTKGAGKLFKGIKRSEESDRSVLVSIPVHLCDDEGELILDDKEQPILITEEMVMEQIAEAGGGQLRRSLALDMSNLLSPGQDQWLEGLDADASIEQITKWENKFLVTDGKTDIPFRQMPQYGCNELVLASEIAGKFDPQHSYDQDFREDDYQRMLEATGGDISHEILPSDHPDYVEVDEDLEPQPEDVATAKKLAVTS